MKCYCIPQKELPTLLIKKTINNSINMKNNITEGILCLLFGTFMAICFLAIMCGFGDKGLLSIF